MPIKALVTEILLGTVFSNKITGNKEVVLRESWDGFSKGYLVRTQSGAIEFRYPSEIIGAIEISRMRGLL